MSIPSKFMEVARGRLDPATFSEIYQRAVNLEAKEQMKPLSPPVDRPAVAARLEAQLNGTELPKQPVPHVQEQIERRLDIEVSPSDLGELLKLAMGGGPNSKVVRQSMELIQECLVEWKGRHFSVIFSKTRGKLITAYIKKKKKPIYKTRIGRPKDWRQDEYTQ